MKICIDGGHGGSDSGAPGKRALEKDINLKIAWKLQDKLSRSGITIVMTRTSDVYVDLQKRCDIANKNNCDYFISIHCNSFSDSNASGTETYYYKGSDEGQKLAAGVQSAVVQYANTKDRGVKTASFYVLKYTKMVAILLETAFISNENEETMLMNEEWIDGLARSIAVSVCNFAGITPNVDDVLYRVIHDNTQIGAYKDKSSALRVAEELLAEMSSGSIMVVSTTGEILMDKTKEPENPGASNNPGLHAISDIMRATDKQMESFVHKINPDAPYLAKRYIEIGMEEGIRGDIAFAQAIKETNYFRFTGNVKKEQNNFAGIGSTGPGVSGASFATADDGIRAHIQHLKAYANTEPLNTALADPRFNMVKRGSAQNFEDLNGKWAVSGDGYGQSVINIWRRILDEIAQDSNGSNDKSIEQEYKSIVDKKTVDEFETIVKLLSDFVDKLKVIKK